MKLFAASLTLLLGAALYSAENLIKTDPGQLPVTGTLKVIDAENGVFKAGKGRLNGTQLIAVDASKSYRLSGFFRGAADCGRVLMGVQCFDSNKRSIGMHNICPVAGTATVLTSAAEKGSNEFFIADGSSWEKIPGKVAAFNCKDDFSDLPNHNTIYYVTKVEKSGEVWKVTTTKALPRTYPAGTAMRLHRDGGFINAIAFVKPNAQWQEFSAVLGKAQVNVNVHKNLWPGTAYVKLFINIYPGSEVEIKDIKLIEEQ